MRAIYFERYATSPVHIHAGSYTKGVYIPDENVVLFKEQQGTFGGEISSFTDRPDFLDEMQPLLQGRTPNVDGVTYSKIKELEYDGTRLKNLIQDARLERELRDKVTSGIDALLEEAK
jgi:hypothetical protein